ncbi:hypothetical protein pclt_cds_613 [Pandoravirus celtis]|uniref:Uncharacterized protein n=1 Tax=Pandoravirus celtis TaxID=2568002 RepID=A0A4D6EHD1_9VIRU|nr:hypothetical protein pclt_cds_613 [Pandoravirus celtis]
MNAPHSLAPGRLAKPAARLPGELFNRNGARMCDALGCRRHARLVQVHRGLFCQRHAAVASRIRARIAPHRGDADEAEARVAEIVFRKRLDTGHLRYAVRLSAHTGWVGTHPDVGEWDTTDGNHAAQGETATLTPLPRQIESLDRYGGVGAHPLTLSDATTTGMGAPEHMVILQGMLDDESKWAPAPLLPQRTHDSMGPWGCRSAHAAPTRIPPHACLPYAARAPFMLDHSARNAKDPTVDGPTMAICPAAGCTKIAHVLINGEGTFCQRHGRIVYAARMRAVALIGNVPFACAAAVVSDDTDMHVSPGARTVARQQAPART